MLASANKLSVVKRKGKSPQFNSQKRNANDNKAEDSGWTDNKRSKHGKKKPRTEKSSSHNHSHLVIVGALVPPPPPPAPVVYLQAKDIPANAPPGLSVMSGNKDRLFYQPLSHMGLKQGTQAFAGAPTTRPDTFPHVNAARDLTDKIGVTKNSLNLKRLEKITECSYSDAVASTSKIVEVEECPKLRERLTSLELSDKEAKASRKKEKCHRLQLEKKFAKSLDKGKGRKRVCSPSSNK